MSEAAAASPSATQQKRQQQQNNNNNNNNSNVAVFHPRKCAITARRGTLAARAVRGGDVVLIDTTVPNSMCASVGDVLDNFHKGSVTSCRFSRDGRYLVSSAEDGSVGLWDTKRCKRVSLQGHKGAVYKAIFNSETTLVGTCGEDGLAILWDISPPGSAPILPIQQQQQQQTSDNNSNINASANSAASSSSPAAAAAAAASTSSSSHSPSAASASLLLSGHNSRPIGETKLVLRGHSGRVMGIAVVENLCATASEDQTVMLWDISTGTCVSVLEGHQGVVYAVNFSPRILGPPVLASASEDGSVIIWDVSLAVASAAQRQKMPPKRAALYAHEGCVFSLAFSRDGLYLATCGEDQNVIVWDTKTWKRRSNLKIEGHTAEISCVCFSPVNSNLLASGSDDSLVMLWDVALQKRLQVLEGNGGVVNHVHFNPEGTMVAASYEDGNTILWDVSAGKLQATLQAHTDEVSSICFSDGTSSSSQQQHQQQQSVVVQQHKNVNNPSHPMYLATGGRDRKVVVWDLKRWKQQATLEKHVGAITALVFSPDLSLLASGSDDTTVVLWDTESWTKKHTLRNHESPICGVKFEQGQGAQHNMLLVRTVDTSGLSTLWNSKDGSIMNTAHVSSLSLLQQQQLAGGGAAMQQQDEDNNNSPSSSSSSFTVSSSGGSGLGGDAASSSSGGGKKRVRFISEGSGGSGLSSSGGSGSVGAGGGGGGLFADPEATGMLSPGGTGAGGSVTGAQRLEYEHDRIRRSYIEEEKTSRFLLLQDRAVDAGRVANRLSKHVAVLDKRDKVRDLLTARMIVLEKEELVAEHKLEAANNLLASQVAHLTQQNHSLERAVAALTGRASKAGVKHEAGESKEVQTFFSVAQSTAADDASWLPLSDEEPFRFRQDAVAFQVLLSSSSASSASSASSCSAAPPSSSSGSSSSSNVVMRFGLCQRRTEKQQQQPTSGEAAAECFIDVDPPLLVQDRCVKGGLAGRPMYGCSLLRFDALRLSKGLYAQIHNWLQLCSAACTNSQRVGHIEIANGLFAAQKATWLLQAVKRQHLALTQQLVMMHQDGSAASSTSSPSAEQHRQTYNNNSNKFPNWLLSFVPLSKSALLDIAAIAQKQTQQPHVGVVEGGNLLAGVAAEHMKHFKPVFDQCSFKAGNSVSANTPGCHATMAGGGGSLVSSLSLERAAARSVILEKRYQQLVKSAGAPPASTAVADISNGLFTQIATAQPAAVPVLMCALAATTIVPAVLPATSEAKGHEKLLQEQIGSSTVLVAGTRRSAFDKLFLDSGNCDYIEAVVMKGSVVVPLGVLWMNTTADFREDVLISSA